MLMASLMMRMNEEEELSKLSSPVAPLAYLAWLKFSQRGLERDRGYIGFTGKLSNF